MLAGHKASLIEAQATDPQKHGLSSIAYNATGWCAADLDTDTIRKNIAQNAVALGTAKKVEDNLSQSQMGRE